MDTQSRDAQAVAQTPEIDPLRRVFVPKECKTSKGTTVLRTLDGVVYARVADGSLRRARKKINGKVARKQRAEVRRAQRD
jgi:hypothetical protein